MSAAGASASVAGIIAAQALKNRCRACGQIIEDAPNDPREVSWTEIILLTGSLLILIGIAITLVGLGY